MLCIFQEVSVRGQFSRENPAEPLGFAGRFGRNFVIPLGFGCETKGGKGVFRLTNSLSPGRIQGFHACRKTLRPNPDLPVYRDHRGNVAIRCYAAWAPTTAPSCAYPRQTITSLGLSGDHYRDDRRGDRNHPGPGPSYAQLPTGDLFRSTTDDTDSNSAPFPHLDPDAGPRLRGYVRRAFRLPCPVLPPPFRPPVGTVFYRRCRRARAVQLQKTKARPRPGLPVLFFQIVDSSCCPFFFAGGYRLASTVTSNAAMSVSAHGSANSKHAHPHFSIQCIPY